MKKVPFMYGTMIEIPRAALKAGEMAETAEFFSFGTNDLTQMTFGFSRDDVGGFVPDYIKSGILPADPFQTLDQSGVGELVNFGHRARPQRPVPASRSASAASTAARPSRSSSATAWA